MFPVLRYSIHSSRGVFAVAGLDVDAVELVALMLLISFALKNFFDFDFVVDKDTDKTLEDVEVCPVAEHLFRCPVETNEGVVVGFHNRRCFNK